VAAVNEVAFGFEMMRCAAAFIKASPWHISSLFRLGETKCAVFIDIHLIEERTEGRDQDASHDSNLFKGGSHPADAFTQGARGCCSGDEDNGDKLTSASPHSNNLALSDDELGYPRRDKLLKQINRPLPLSVLCWPME
jgi:hypothetical protein